MRLMQLRAALLAFALACAAGATAEDGVLRVCADPNNLPLSHRNGEGFENRIAALLAHELGWQLEYAWWPQRMGFIRNTLKARIDGSDRYKCDLVIGVPTGYELTATTRPYYRSTWTLVYARGRGLDGVATPEDLLRLEPARLQTLRLGAFGQTPPVDWLLRHGLIGQVVPYRPQTGDPEQYTGEIVDRDLREGRIDVAFVWGPIAGWFARRDPAHSLVVVPFAPEAEIKFDYAIAMGVRFGEREWKARLEQLLERQRGAIEAILAGYGVPLLDEAGRLRPAPAAMAAERRPAPSGDD